LRPLVLHRKKAGIDQRIATGEEQCADIHFKCQNKWEVCKGCWTISPLYHWFVKHMHNLETLPAMHNHIHSIKLSSPLTKDTWLVTQG
jgi:hypothetical protein